MTNARLELRPTATMIKAGAIVMRRLEKSEHESLLHATGFENISAEVTQIHSPDTIVGLAGAWCCPDAREISVASAFVRATSP